MVVAVTTAAAGAGNSFSLNTTSVSSHRPGPVQRGPGRFLGFASLGPISLHNFRYRKLLKTEPNLQARRRTAALSSKRGFAAFVIADADGFGYRNNVEKLRTRVSGLIREGKSQDDVDKVLTAEYRWQPNSLNMQWSLPGMMTELK